MQLLPLTDSKQEKIAAILIKESAAKPSSVLSGYYNFFSKPEVADILAVAPLYYAPNGKISVGDAKEYLSTLLPMLYVQGIRYLYVADSTYFKILSGEKKADVWRGYAIPCALKGFEDLTIVLGYNFNVLFHNPTYEPYIVTTMAALEAAMVGTELAHTNFQYTEHRVVDMTHEQSDYWFSYLIDKPELTLDLEAFSLKFYNAGIATASIAWSETEALTFNIDMRVAAAWDVNVIQRNKIAFDFLCNFLDFYQGNMTYHNGSFDIKVLVFEIYMKKDFFNYAGMIEGINALTKNFDDTKLITYCATNNAVSNKLSLKEAAHGYVGNYALDDIKDVTQIPLGDLLNYNGVDSVATYWLKKKNYPLMVADSQLQVYEEILKPSVKLFLQAELVGLPLDMDRVLEAIKECEEYERIAIAKIMDNPLMKDYAEQKATYAFDNQHERWKKKRETMEFFRNEFEFNPNSGDQVADFLYEYIGFEPIEFTDGGAPATSKDALKPLKHQTDDPIMLEVLQGLEELSEVSIILNNFLKTFRDESVLKEDGVYWIHGSHNIGGTKSGRLSSSDPNLQNMPSKGKFGKLVKSCIVAPKGWLFCGADFASLEDKIDALLTKDTNKIKIYTDGFDGHCLRAAYYFNDIIVGIDITNVDSVNSIKELYPVQRDASKAPTFALTYMGTAYTLVKQCGFSEAKAKEIEASYKVLYKESDDYKMARLKQAAEDGYATLAFGLRIRCKVLAKSMFGSKYMSSAAKAEMRTIGNAFGQSFGMLNNRAGIAFQETTLNGVYAQQILPIMHIHDAQYFLIKDDLEILHYANQHIAKEMSWQELPEIAHPLVHLGGELDVFIPTWADKHTIPNHATVEDIRTIGDTINV